MRNTDILAKSCGVRRLANRFRLWELESGRCRRMTARSSRGWQGAGRRVVPAVDIESRPPPLNLARNMLRSRHGHDPEKGKAPDTAAAHGFAPRTFARAGAAAGAALGAGFARSQGARGNPP